MKKIRMHTGCAHVVYEQRIIRGFATKQLRSGKTLSIREVSGSKVCNLNGLPVGGPEKIGWLDISVDDALGVY